MEASKKMPLFIITGSSGVGKSTISSRLFQNESRYIVLESDILWNDIYNKPAEGYKEYRELWLKMCANISQIGMPVVLCGCATPEQFESCANRKLVSSIHYLAIVSDDDVLKGRLREGRKIDNQDWINSSKSFNKWLKENADKTEPTISLLDYSTISLEEAARYIDSWICEYLD